MRNINIAFAFACALVLIHNQDFVECSKCSRQTIYYVSQHYCASRTLWWCSTHAYRRLARYRIITYCCTGYTGDNCETPICNPPCNSGGTCVAPNTCACPEGHMGDVCQDAICSHVYPCFPGNCTDPRDCTCQKGFQGTNCSELTSQSAPSITQCSTKIYNIRRVDGVELYRYWADASSPNSSETEVLWVNEQRYNYLVISFQALFEQPDIQDLPNYIGNFSFGITDGFAEVLLVKLGRDGGSAYVSLNETKRCSGSLGPVNPHVGAYACNITYPEFDRTIEHGDFINVTVTVQSGGFREIMSTVTGNLVQVEPYSPQSRSKTMQFYFDFIKPYHCIENNTCTILPLSVSEDVTKSAIGVSWGGWEDTLSGIHKYQLEVFEMVKDINTGYLTENTTAPLCREEMPATNVEFPTITPPVPGVYSFVLGAVDRANNSEFTRQIVIYDPNSQILINNAGTFFVSSTENGTDHKWQSNLQDESGNGSSVVLQLADHFINKVHTDGGFLNKVATFPEVRLEEDERSMLLKSVEDLYDDHSGSRSVDRIPNRNGIVKIEYAYLNDYANGTDIENIPEVGWNMIDLDDDQKSMNIPRKDGETVRIWLRATDVMGNTLYDNTTVHFDSSKPLSGNISLNRNVENGTFSFSSRLNMSALDYDSGIRSIQLRLKDASSMNVLYVDEVAIEPINQCNGDDCVCSPAGLCFTKTHNIEFNNCWLVVPKENLSTQVIILETEAVNMAMLKEITRFQIENLTLFDGIDKGNGVENLREDKDITDYLRIIWDIRPSCYEREDFQILLTDEQGDTINITVPKDDNFVNIYGLKPDTSYKVELVLNYVKDGTPQTLSLIVVTPIDNTGEMSIAMVTAIAAVLAILLGLIVIGIILWRTGQLEGAGKKVRKRITMYLERPLTTFRPKTGVYSGQFDEDIYSFGEKMMNEDDRWLINFDDVMLDEKIAKGHFSDIYRAKLFQNQVVAAKVLQAGFSNEDKLVMTAKINFNATKLGEHVNIVKFYGVVLNNPEFGPYMVLEYCAKGTLQDWLRKKKSLINEDVIDQISEMLCGVAKGMEYLHSVEIVHRRLAAKNILLNEDLEPKIIGFGPTPELREEEEAPRVSRISRIMFKDQAGGKERIPIKWMAPECMKSTLHATTKSDAWSFGIVLWETFSIGEMPYPGIKNRQLATKLREGYRMKRPEFCPDIHAAVMYKCWAEDQDERPDFPQIVEDLEKIYNERYSCNMGANDSV